MFELFKTKEKKWWEKEAEENGLTVEAYLNLLKLKKENAELELRKLKEKGEHVCDSLCEGCQNLIECKELYVPDYSPYGVRKYTTRECALNRKCKEYKAKECKK